MSRVAAFAALPLLAALVVRAAPEPTEDRPEVPPPPFTEGIFPCTGCHSDMEVNRSRRELIDFHTEITLEHDEEHRWCLDCHDATERDSLHLASGERVPFEESYRLCGQCHGEKLRDWRAGIHGRRTGQWNGHKLYLLCAHCHSPHQPRFRPLAPKPPPEPPRRFHDASRPEAGDDAGATPSDAAVVTPGKTHGGVAKAGAQAGE